MYWSIFNCEVLSSSSSLSVVKMRERLGSFISCVVILGLHTGGPRTTWFLLIKGGFVLVGFQELVSRVEASLEEISSPQWQRKQVYSMRKRLRHDMIGDNPIYQLFVSGSRTGCGVPWGIGI